MRTSDPIGRWGPYDEARRTARRRAATVLLLAIVVLAGLAGLAYLFAVSGVQGAP